MTSAGDINRVRPLVVEACQGRVDAAAGIAIDADHRSPSIARRQKNYSRQQTDESCKRFYSDSTNGVGSHRIFPFFGGGIEENWPVYWAWCMVLSSKNWVERSISSARNKSGSCPTRVQDCERMTGKPETVPTTSGSISNDGKLQG